MRRVMDSKPPPQDPTVLSHANSDSLPDSNLSHPERSPENPPLSSDDDEVVPASTLPTTSALDLKMSEASPTNQGLAVDGSAPGEENEIFVVVRDDQSQNQGFSGFLLRPIPTFVALVLSFFFWVYFIAVFSSYHIPRVDHIWTRSWLELAGVGKILRVLFSIDVELEVDVNDLEWRKFRNSVGYMSLLLFLYGLAFRMLKSALLACCGSTAYGTWVFVSLRMVAGIVFVTIIHRPIHALFLLGITVPVALFVMFLALRLRWFRVARLLLWLWCIAVIAGVPFVPWEENRVGLFVRFWDHLNFQVLRLISFGETVIRDEEFAYQQKQLNVNEAGDGGSEDFASESTDPAEGVVMKIFLYLSYLTYPCTYLAGPIIQYPGFRSFLLGEEDSEENRASFGKTLWYGCTRLLIAFLAIDVFLSFVHVPSMVQAGMISEFEGVEVAVFGLFSLAFVFLKLNAIWKFFRMWSLWDGIVPVENVQRCVFGFTGIRDFWRNWHVSFGKWLIKYVYIPLGGKERRVFAATVVFVFVGLWHNGLDLRLITWGFLISLLYVGESLFVKHVEKGRRCRWWLRMVRCYFVALLLLAVCQIGFVGWEAAWTLVRNAATWQSLVLRQPLYFLVSVCFLVGADGLRNAFRKTEECRGMPTES